MHHFHIVFLEPKELPIVVSKHAHCETILHKDEYAAIENFLLSIAHWPILHRFRTQAPSYCKIA